MAGRQCTHINQIRAVTPSSSGCEECVKLGDTWVDLRLCLSCGNVACCDSSRHRHARAHAREDGHPIVQSFRPGEDWRWCYEDGIYM